MTLDRQALEFLAPKFRLKNEAELEMAFGWVYEKDRFGQEENAEMRKSYIGDLTRTINELERLPDNADRETVLAVCTSLPAGVYTLLETELAGESDLRDVAIGSVSDTKSVSQIWYRENPISAGRNAIANAIARAVSWAFGDLGKPARDGRAPDGKSPSTPFGQVVEHALKHHGNSAHWRRPTERNVHKNKVLIKKRANSKPPGLR